jgi:hypothetical protein
MKWQKKAEDAIKAGFQLNKERRKGIRPRMDADGRRWRISGVDGCANLRDLRATPNRLRLRQAEFPAVKPALA